MMYGGFDDVRKKKADLLVLDVEGHEMTILESINNNFPKHPNSLNPQIRNSPNPTFPTKHVSTKNSFFPTKLILENNGFLPGHGH